MALNPGHVKSYRGTEAWWWDRKVTIRSTIGVCQRLGQYPYQGFPILNALKKMVYPMRAPEWLPEKSSTIFGWAYAVVPRAKPISPTTPAAMPPISIQIALFVGEPVKNRDTSELKEWVAFIPKITSRIPMANKAMQIGLFIV